MMDKASGGSLRLPLKSVATALIFSVLLGPVGLLYASFWGGLIMTLLVVSAYLCQFYFIVAMLWIVCSIWGTRSVETYNRTICSS